MPHVLIVEENNYVPVDRRVWYEATALRDAGWEVTILCPYDTRDNPPSDGRNRVVHEDLEGISIFRFPLKFADRGVGEFIGEYISAFFHITGAVWRIWRAKPFDILHFCNPPDFFAPLGLFFRAFGVKFVFDHHDLFPEMVGWRYKGLPGRLLLVVAEWLERLSLRWSDLVITTNESYRNRDIQKGKISPEKVIIVRNGPKLEDFKPQKPFPQLKQGFPYMVCFVGVMGDDDGVLELIDIIHYIIGQLKRSDILFALVGDGPVWQHVMKRIEQLELDEYVHMPGMIREQERLREYLATADVMVSPEPITPMNAVSTFIKIGEYMAMGKPTVAFDLHESRVTADGAASFVPPGDLAGFGKEIVNLIDDPHRRIRMGEIGRNRIETQFAWEHQRDYLIQAYQQLVKK